MSQRKNFDALSDRGQRHYIKRIRENVHVNIEHDDVIHQDPINHDEL